MITKETLKALDRFINFKFKDLQEHIRINIELLKQLGNQTYRLTHKKTKVKIYVHWDHKREPDDLPEGENIFFITKNNLLVPNLYRKNPTSADIKMYYNELMNLDKHYDRSDDYKVWIEQSRNHKRIKFWATKRMWTKIMYQHYLKSKSKSEKPCTLDEITSSLGKLGVTIVEE